MQIGILALQGGYQAHANILQKLLFPWKYVRYASDLKAIDGLIIPGGESSVLLHLLKKQDLFDSLKTFNKPLLGTCAGAILLAKQVFSPRQPSLGHIDIIQVSRYAHEKFWPSCPQNSFA